MILAEVDWSALLQSPYIVPTAAIVGGVVVTGVLAWMYARSVRLKEKMIERGFTADEIEQVIKAKGK